MKILIHRIPTSTQLGIQPEYKITNSLLRRVAENKNIGEVGRKRSGVERKMPKYDKNSLKTMSIKPTGGTFLIIRLANYFYVIILYNIHNISSVKEL